MKNGSTVAAFERAFADYVGAKYAIALCNGTATLHTALAALGVEPGDKVAVPPLTMASTTIAVLHAGGVPVFVDVDPRTWIAKTWHFWSDRPKWGVPVSLFGLYQNMADTETVRLVDDAAQTLRRLNPNVSQQSSFTSYSFQASKILALSEGGMLVTNDENLASRAREFSSLGYDMRADQPRIDPAVLKHPSFARHHSLGWNYRMSDAVAERGLNGPLPVGWGAGLMFHEALDRLKAERRRCAAFYREAHAGCPWITAQRVPEDWTHDYWCYAVALESAELWEPFVNAIVRHGGERPYAAWRITYQEPAFRHLAEDGTCPIAEDLQPRLVQFQTNLGDSRRNADAMHEAIREIDG